MRRSAPIMRKPLRDGYVAILKAAKRNDWAEVHRLHAKMPAQYRAISGLLVFASRFRST